MYAIIHSGGKQYRVREGDFIQIERLDGEVGDPVHFDQVLLFSDDKGIQVGNPVVQDARVSGTIAEQGKGEKVIVFKFKRRKMYRRKQGHRQLFTGVKIEKIEYGDLAPLPEPKAKRAEEEIEPEVKQKVVAEPKREARARPKKIAKPKKAAKTTKPEKKTAKKETKKKTPEKKKGVTKPKKK